MSLASPADRATGDSRRLRMQQSSCDGVRRRLADQAALIRQNTAQFQPLRTRTNSNPRTPACTRPKRRRFHGLGAVSWVAADLHFIGPQRSASTEYTGGGLASSRQNRVKMRSRLGPSYFVIGLATGISSGEAVARCRFPVLQCSSPMVILLPDSD